MKRNWCCCKRMKRKGCWIF